MIKTINIGGKDVDFKLTLSAFFIFKNQFGYDGLQKLLPIIGEVVEGLDGKEFRDKEGKIKADQDMFDTLGQILQNVYSFELTEILNLIWSFAKNADSKVPLPDKWFNQFDDFPLFDVVRELVPAMYGTLITKKKLTDTKTTKKK